MASPEKRRALGWTVVLIALAYAIGWSTELVGFPSPYPNLGFVLRTVLILLFLFSLLKYLHLRIIKGNLNGWAKNLRLVGISLFFFYFLVELPFTFIPLSTGAGQGPGARVWFHYYWEFNNRGYRDVEIEERDTSGKVNLFVLGDSFVAGHGIKDPQDRFSDRLAEMLPDNYEVYNLGESGSDTRKQFENLSDFPLRPDYLVWSHIPNDIERIYTAQPTSLREEPPLLHAQLISTPSLRDRYFLLDYVIRQINAPRNPPRLHYTREMVEGKDNYLRYYLDPKAFRQHMAEIDELLGWARHYDIPVLAMLFPETPDPILQLSSDFINAPLIRELRQRNLPVLDLTPLIRNIPAPRRMVSWLDAHPSVESHHRVADTLQQTLRRLGWIP